MAARTQAGGQAKPQAAAAKSIEKLDPAKRAEFLKLIGANWIWSPAYPEGRSAGRRLLLPQDISAEHAEFAQVHVACDNQYELYVNGRLAGRGNDWRKMDVHDISKLLVPGHERRGDQGHEQRRRGGRAGGARRGQGEGRHVRELLDRRHVADERETAGRLDAAKVRDSEWLPAKVYGPLGGVLPWGDEIVIADEGSRFLIDPEFAVERLVTDEQAGSLIAMAFNANGDILASQEGGGLLLDSRQE